MMMNKSLNMSIKAPVAGGRAVAPTRTLLKPVSAAPPGGPAPEPSFPVAGELPCVCLWLL